MDLVMVPSAARDDPGRREVALRRAAEQARVVGPKRRPGRRRLP